MADPVAENTTVRELITAHRPAMVAYVDSDLRYRFANRAYEEWYGFAPGEMDGRTVRDGVGETVFRALSSAIARVRRGDDAHFDVAVTDPADGRERQLDVQYLADLEPGSPGIRGYVVVAYDVTVQKRTERALIDRNTASDLLTETIPQGIWRCDPDGQAEYVTQRFCQIVGYPFETMLGWGWAAVIHPEDRDRVLNEWSAARAAGGPIAIEFRVRSGDGRYRWFLSLGNPLRNEAGDIVKYYGTWTNIDPQKKIEFENFELLRRERAALRARDEFLSVASHELKTPLTSLKLQAQLIRHLKEKNDPRAYDHARIDALVEQVDRQTNRLNGLVDAMLDISRIQTGRLGIERRLVDLADIIAGALARLRTQHDVSDAGGLTVDRINSCQIFADPLRIEQVLVNLLANALRFGEGRPAHLGVREGVGEVTITVRDEGRGVPSEMRSRIFERFERAVPFNEISGLGLGLFIAKEIVVAHGGEITLDEESARGASFSVRLPTSPETVDLV